jgi:phosphoribosylglycinamide formyltransferase-1
MARLRVAALISGRGSNLQALIDAAADPAYPAEIVLVLSNEPTAAGLRRATDAGIATTIVDHRNHASRHDFEAEIDKALAAHRVELVCLAGFMRLLTAEFSARWHDRLINIHPSLLPKYKGLDTHERVLADGEASTGCTIHFVRPDMDSGPIIAQAEVEVRAGDTADSLAARVLAEEHVIYPRVVKAIAEGRVHVHGERVTVDGGI